MATQPIKTRFELDGEKEYKAAVSEINASLRVLNSEMKLISDCEQRRPFQTDTYAERKNRSFAGCAKKQRRALWRGGCPYKTLADLTQ